MAGGTHVFDMIKRLKENSNLRNKKSFFKNKQAHTGSSKSSIIDTKVETEEQRKEIEAALKKETIKEKERLITILVLSILLTTIAFLLIFKFVL
jgi:heme/copper-type cytochrome/quinol oxidase subunit 4